LESNWRYNVPDVGMAYSNWRKAARYVVQPPFRIRWVVQVDDNVFGEVWQQDFAGELPHRIPNFNLPGKFPYLQVVEPDHP